MYLASSWPDLLQQCSFNMVFLANLRKQIYQASRHATHDIFCMYTRYPLKMALPDYKNCIWVTSQSVKSIGYQDSPFDQRLLSVHIAFLSSSIRYQDSLFELRTAFEVTRDCRTLDFLRVLRFELRLHFKSFYKFHFFQNHILPSYILSPIILHELQKRSLTLCICISSIPTNPTWTLQESQSFIWRPWHIDLSLALLQKDLTSLSCVVLYLDLLTQQAPQQHNHPRHLTMSWLISWLELVTDWSSILCSYDVPYLHIVDIPWIGEYW